MSRETLNFSMYSDMSMRVMAFSSCQAHHGHSERSKAASNIDISWER